MGSNGSFSSGILKSEEGRAYETIYKIDDNMVVLEQKNKRKGVKLPEESHTPGRYYVAFKKDGSDVKSFAKYGQDGLKIWEVHTDDHHGLKPHYHPWLNGEPVENDVRKLTQEMLIMLNRIRNFKN